MNAVIYCRVSSKEQVDGTSLESQEIACKEYAARNHLNVVRIFVERGESAKFADRTQLLELLDFCGKREHDVQQLLVWKVDRLARNVGDLVLFDKVAAGNFDDFQPGSLMGLKLGVIRDYWFVGLHPEVERVTDLALKKMVDAGVVLVESQIPDLALLIQNSTPQVQLHDVLVELPQYLLESGSNVTFEQ